MPSIVERAAPAREVANLVAAGVPPLLARLYAARGIVSAQSLETGLDALEAPDTMRNLADAAVRLADAIAARRRMLIVADYDADGATSCAVGLRALRAFGADVRYFVPNRFEHGYGLSPEIARIAWRHFQPDLLITVDNGIASVEGVAEAARLGMETLITDHHLPGAELPAAACIVNPNQPGCAFPSKHLAGVGVMFYVMVALRGELRRRGAVTMNLADLLPLVALGTVADVVPLDRNNRILVHQGLARIRAGRLPAGLAALFRVAGCDAREATARDLAFALGPRLNAAGRLTDMGLGIECLTTDDAGRALELAAELDRLNRERREIESGMQRAALAAVDGRKYEDSYTLALFDPEWHPGIIGIVAGRMKEQLHRPVIAFARGNGGEIRGSGRSIPALHLRDALDQVAVREPGLILRFGGHAAAAGLTLREPDFERFRRAFEDTGRRLLTPADLQRVIETDGPLEPEHCSLETVSLLSDVVWGQGFPPPRFCNEFEVLSQRVVGGRHLKLALRDGGLRVEAMRFNWVDPAPRRARFVHQPAINDFDGRRSLQLNIEHWEAA